MLTLSPSLPCPDPIRLLQITDTHLFASDTGSLLSINTADSFLAVIQAIKEQDLGFDAVLATGDISQDHSLASYQRFAQGVAQLQAPCFWLPGNHDDKPKMQQALNAPLIHAQEHVLLGEHWQLILLDSQVLGVPYGELSQQQLDLLQTKLAAYPRRHALVLLHHHSLLIGSAWLDQHNLKHSNAFWDIVLAYPQVKAVVCGHVHQEKEIIHNDIKVLTTPSTCVQFKPDSDEFALDRCSPGWRELQLYQDGQVITQVKRLAKGLFLPDFNSNGY